MNNTFDELYNESIKKLGKLKIKRPKDAANSPRFNMFRSANRKNPNMIPDKYSSVRDLNITTQMSMAEKLLNVAKDAPSGIWKISRSQVLDIARKYRFNIPDKHKKSKHLGSTGIQMIRYKPGVYYLFKPRKSMR